VGALLAARTCAGYDREISQEEAIEIATENATFEPCTRTGCVVIRAVPRGIPSRLYWLVGLADDLDEDGEPTRFVNVLVDVQTGDVVEP
jgi:hypothetical protein